MRRGEEFEAAVFIFIFALLFPSMIVSTASRGQWWDVVGIVAFEVVFAMVWPLAGKIYRIRLPRR